jgi:hypothetical protein
MRDFFKQCLEDMEALTGNRQMYFMTTDVDGPRKLKVCLDGMVLASADYPYIPEEAQQKIIREQMVKDQTYDALNSRMIHKWLGQASGKYFRESIHAAHLSDEEMKPAEELTEPTKKLIQEYMATLAGVGKQTPRLTPEQIKAEGQERKDPLLRGAVASGYKPDPRKVEQAERLDRVVRQLGLHEVKEASVLNRFTIGGQMIVARDEVEAQYIYSEVYAEETTNQ